MRFRREPPHVHGSSAPRTAVLLVNLGTPEAATAPAVRTYLREFLSDPRVVEIPRLIWWCILNGIILPIRSSRSAAKYALIWGKEGSPLKVFTAAQAKLLGGILGERGLFPVVDYAMRYGSPALADQLDALKAANVGRILILPLYPQYSATTTASTNDAVSAWASGIRNQPELRFVRGYHDHPAYIKALAARVRATWDVQGRTPGSTLLLSFHGVPLRTLMLGDPYHCECLKTGRLLGEALGLTGDEVVISFQSRFGKAEWLRPYTTVKLEELGRKGGAVDVFCPGFPADCLETLEEIALEGKQTFLNAGGKEFRFIPCMNDHPAWIAGLADIAEQHLQGWSLAAPAVDAVADAAQRRRALERGAST